MRRGRGKGNREGGMGKRKGKGKGIGREGGRRGKGKGEGEKQERRREEGMGGKGENNRAKAGGGGKTDKLQSPGLILRVGGVLDRSLCKKLTEAARFIGFTPLLAHPEAAALAGESLVVAINFAETIALIGSMI